MISHEYFSGLIIDYVVDGIEIVSKKFRLYFACIDDMSYLVARNG